MSELMEDDDSSDSGALIVIKEESNVEDSDDEYTSTIEPKDEDASSLCPLLRSKNNRLSEYLSHGRVVRTWHHLWPGSRRFRTTTSTPPQENQRTKTLRRSSHWKVISSCKWKAQQETYPSSLVRSSSLLDE